MVKYILLWLSSFETISGSVKPTINANNFIKRSCSAKITNKNTLYYFYLSVLAGPRSAIGRAPDS